KAPLRGSLGDRFAAQLGMDPRVLSFAISRHNEPVPGKEDAETHGVVVENAQVGQIPISILASPVNVPITDSLETLVEVIPEEIVPSSISSRDMHQSDEGPQESALFSTSTVFQAAALA